MAVKDAEAKKPRRTKKAAKAKDSEKHLKVKLVCSLIGQPKKQKEVVKGLGLRKIDSVVIRKDGPEIRGMINKVSHLVDVEVLEKK